MQGGEVRLVGCNTQRIGTGGCKPLLEIPHLISVIFYICILNFFIGSIHPGPQPGLCILNPQQTNRRHFCFRGIVNTQSHQVVFARRYAQGPAVIGCHEIAE